MDIIFKEKGKKVKVAETLQVGGLFKGERQFGTAREGEMFGEVDIKFINKLLIKCGEYVIFFIISFINVQKCISVWLPFHLVQYR